MLLHSGSRVRVASQDRDGYVNQTDIFYMTMRAM